MASEGHASASTRQVGPVSPSLGGYFSLSFPSLMHTGHILPLQSAQTTHSIACNASSSVMATIISEDLWNYTKVEVSQRCYTSTHDACRGCVVIQVTDFSRTWSVIFGAQEMYYEAPWLLLGSASSLTGHGARVALEHMSTELLLLVGAALSLWASEESERQASAEVECIRGRSEDCLESLTSIYTSST